MLREMKVDLLDQMKRKWLGMEAVEAPEYQVIWCTNTLCNFRCEYCIGRGELLSRDFPTEEHPDVGKYSPQHIAKCFDDTGKTWRIYAAPWGETFMYPRFVELAKALTERHYIEVNTNLSTPNVYEFADVIPPERVTFICTSLHILEREKRKNGVRDYLDKFLYLQDRGFAIGLLYVAYPPLFTRLARDMEYFRSQGVKLLWAQAFVGVYKGRLYPESFTPEERRMLYEYALHPRATDAFLHEVNSFGRLCSAGQKSFQMGLSGELSRCMRLPRKYGNLFTGEYHFDESPRPCPVKECSRCPSEALRLPGNERGSAYSILKEMAEQSYMTNGALHYMTHPLSLGGVMLRILKSKVNGK